MELVIIIIIAAIVSAVMLIINKNKERFVELTGETIESLWSFENTAHGYEFKVFDVHVTTDRDIIIVLSRRSIETGETIYKPIQFKYYMWGFRLNDMLNELRLQTEYLSRFNDQRTGRHMVRPTEDKYKDDPRPFVHHIEQEGSWYTIDTGIDTEHYQEWNR